MNYWLMLGEASAQICVPWSLCRLYLSLVPSPAATTSFASSKFWSHYWGCHLQSLGGDNRTRETFRSFSESYLTAGKAVRDSSWQHQPCQSQTWTQHLPKLLPAFQPLTFTVRETGTQRHQNANLELIQDAATTTFWEQSLRVFPGMAHLFNPMENEGFPHSYTHCWSQVTALVQASALQAS